MDLYLGQETHTKISESIFLNKKCEQVTSENLGFFHQQYDMNLFEYLIPSFCDKALLT